MDKKRNDAIMVGADKPAIDLSVGAPRGKRRGGADTLLPLNSFERGQIKQACEKENRSFSSFIRLAALEKAKSVLGD